MTIIAVKNLSRNYGTLKAVEAFSFGVEAGEIMAVMGPDGAGKTSLFRSLCGLIDFTADETTIAGFRVKDQYDQIKPLLGYMPQIFSLYPDLSVEENLNFYSGLFGLRGGALEKRKDELYQFSGLGPFRGRRAGQLSGGMKQKLALSCNLVHDPKVLILDEPTTGVDPLSRRQFWEILKSLRAGGSTIVVSTPYMDEVAMADRAVFMFGGKKLSEGTPTQLEQQYRGKVFQVDVEPTVQRMHQLATAGLDSRRFGASVHVYIPADYPADELNSRLQGLDVKSDAVREISPGLEDVFIQLMGK
jgi:ABC-2 type transport system ATP-binding protein